MRHIVLRMMRHDVLSHIVSAVRRTEQTNPDTVQMPQPEESVLNKERAKTEDSANGEIEKARNFGLEESADSAFRA